MSDSRLIAPPQPVTGTPRLRALHPVEFVEEFATNKQRCAVLQRLFAYRKRLLEAKPLWFTQVLTGQMLEPGGDSEHVTVQTIFVGTDQSSEQLQHRFPDLFVSASVRSRFKLEGGVAVATAPSELFHAARATSLDGRDAVEIPLLTAKEEGAARALLETQRVHVRKGPVPRSTDVALEPASSDDVAAKGEASRPAVVDPLPSTPEIATRSSLELIAYDVGSHLPIHLQPATSDRDWIERSSQRFAARCLPLLIANQSGWEVVLDEELTATWNGKSGTKNVMIECSPRMRGVASSHFGLGILTFQLQYLFRTPPGYNLLVRGPANRPKAGISALEGVIETDWTAASFTMNWQITEVLRAVRFAAGEVIALIVPQRRGELERFEPRLVPLPEDPDLASRHEFFKRSRSAFVKDLKVEDSPAQEAGWQRYYFQGRDPDGTVAPEHQTKLKLKPFV
jgi:hypothetical protein